MGAVAGQASRKTAMGAAYDDYNTPTEEANEDDFMYAKVTGLDLPDVGAAQLLGPKKIFVEFKVAGKLGVSFDREDADLRVVEVAKGGLAALDGRIKPGMQVSRLLIYQSPACFTELLWGCSCTQSRRTR